HYLLTSPVQVAVHLLTFPPQRSCDPPDNRLPLHQTMVRGLFLHFAAPVLPSSGVLIFIWRQNFSDCPFDVVFRALSVFRGLEMDGSATGTAAAHDELGRFRAGNSEYRARKQRLAEIVQTLAAEFDPTPSQVRLLPIIARHMDDAERARTAE